MAVFPRTANALVKVLMLTSSVTSTRAYSFSSLLVLRSSSLNNNFLSHQRPYLPTKRFLSSSFGMQDSVVSTCKDKICAALETDQVKVTGAHDDPNGSHISIEVVSTMFEGKRLMQRQQMVYKAIWDEMQGPVHAVDSMVCKAPSEVV